MFEQKTPFQANVSLWQNCNLKCPYCFASPTAPPKKWSEDVAERLDQLLGFLDATGQWTLTMSGGEVTIYPGFSEICRRLDEAGHRVEFFTNGVKPLAEVFPDGSIRHVARVGLSYQLGSEKSPRATQVFEQNVAFLLASGVEADVNYVMYPDRPGEPEEVKNRFMAMGADFRFLAFQGEYQGQQYPYAYTRELKDGFSRYGDLRAAYLLEHGYHMPTFKRCRAGHETFYISLRRGQVFTCEQLQVEALADFTSPEGPAQFRAALAPQPIVCTAKRCSCRLTVDQEEFLAENDVWDMSSYPGYEQVSRPLPMAVQHWERRLDSLCAEISGRMTGDELFLWGGGVHTLNLMKVFAEGGFPLEKIKGIIEGNSLKHGQTISGVEIISVDRFAQVATAGRSEILISSRAFEEEIVAVIAERFGDSFPVIRMYDGRLNASFEAVQPFEVVEQG